MTEEEVLTLRCHYCDKSARYLFHRKKSVAMVVDRDGHEMMVCGPCRRIHSQNVRHAGWRWQKEYPDGE